MGWMGRLVGDPGEDADAEPEPADVLDVGGLLRHPDGRVTARGGLVWSDAQLFRADAPPPGTGRIAAACATCVQEWHNAGVLEGATNRPLAPGKVITCELCGEAMR